MAKGNEYRDAVRATDAVLDCGHFRPETAHRAIGATLSYLGARRCRAACTDDDARAETVLELLATAEEAAVALDAIPQKVWAKPQRSAQWTIICGALARVKHLIDAEHEDIKAATAAEVLGLIGSATA